MAPEVGVGEEEGHGTTGSEVEEVEEVIRRVMVVMEDPGVS